MRRNHEVAVDEMEIETVADVREHEKDSRADRRRGKGRDKRKAGWSDYDDEDDGWN